MNASLRPDDNRSEPTVSNCRTRNACDLEFRSRDESRATNFDGGMKHKPKPGILDFQSDDGFIPASNIKIFTSCSGAIPVIGVWFAAAWVFIHYRAVHSEPPGLMQK